MQFRLALFGEAAEIQRLEIAKYNNKAMKDRVMSKTIILYF